MGKIKSTVVKIATTMKDAAKLIETPFKTVFNQLKTKLPAALKNKDDCSMLKIKPDSVGTEEKRYNWCETILKTQMLVDTIHCAGGKICGDRVLQPVQSCHSGHG